MKWSVHVGDSFTDVPRSHPFYRKIETLFHNGVTLGCTATTYCLSDKVPRVNMAIFIARAIAGGAGFLPDRGVVNGDPVRLSRSRAARRSFPTWPRRIPPVRRSTTWRP